MPRPIVLVHGLIGHLREPRIVDSISGAPVFAPDLLGYGEYAAVEIEGISLQEQADYVAAAIRALADGPVHVAGHSVGGAIAILLARAHSELIASLTSIEGNFTLKDAFWSGKLARLDRVKVESVFARHRADLNGWLASVEVPANSWTRTVARSWLDNQPASTIRAQARAVVEATGAPDYLQAVRDLLSSGIPLHLVAGERSQSGWDVADWVRSQAASYTAIAGTGHLMMLEDPEAFGAALTKLLTPHRSA